VFLFKGQLSYYLENKEYNYTMAIGILPMELRKMDLPSCPIDRLIWPHQDAPSVHTVGELGPDDQIVVYPNSRIFYQRRPKLACKLSLILTEPKAIHAKYYRTLCFIRHRFYKIICRYPEYAKTFDNVLLLPVVETWVTDSKSACQIEKTKTCSLIASNKKNLKGHKLRHSIANWLKVKGLDVDLLGRAYQPIDNKENGLAPYLYSIVIENNEEKDYFTEKLIDCMLCNTMPIYWGCPNIADYFNVSGMIVCKSAQELKSAIINTTQPITAKQYLAMAQNKATAIEMSQLNEHIVTLLKEQKKR